LISGVGAGVVAGAQAARRRIPVNAIMGKRLFIEPLFIYYAD